jgi:hypothetical protein
VAADAFFKNLPNTQAVPLDWAVPLSLEVQIQVATANYDGSGAASSFLPALQIIGPGGVVAGTFVDPSTPVAAGGSAEVTFGPFLKSRAAAPSGGTLDDVIFENNPDAWWKEDESSGVVAFDSTANRFDQPLGTGESAPTWGQAAGPPGTQTAEFDTTVPQGFFLTTYPALTDNFSATGWIYRLNNEQNYIVGQSSPAVRHKGWTLTVDAHNEVPENHASLWVGTGTSLTTLDGDNPIPLQAWTFLGMTCAAKTFTFYVNGDPQATAAVPAYVTEAGIWLANDPFDASQSLARNSYVNIFGHPLTDAEHKAIYLAA